MEGAGRFRGSEVRDGMAASHQEGSDSDPGNSRPFCGPDGLGFRGRGREADGFFHGRSPVEKSGLDPVRGFSFSAGPAGSVPAGARPGWWKSLFLGLKRRGVRILVDGKGQLLREGLQAGVEWAKANLAEAEETMDRRGMGGCLAGMRNLSRGRCSLLITLGPRGLVVQEGRKKMAVPAPKIGLWDATGSGDVVTAALVQGIRKGWEIGKVAGFAVWAGSEKAASRDEVVKRLKG
ncbi:MAG: hypothetical protein EBT68_05760 [Verrucomicrobia bacterium]|nr:hypothetical protein [Verrucomicrobiota bacterium]